MIYIGTTRTWVEKCWLIHNNNPFIQSRQLFISIFKVQSQLFMKKSANYAQLFRLFDQILRSLVFGEWCKGWNKHIIMMMKDIWRIVGIEDIKLEHGLLNPSRLDQTNQFLNLLPISTMPRDDIIIIKSEIMLIQYGTRLDHPSKWLVSLQITRIFSWYLLV